MPVHREEVAMLRSISTLVLALGILCSSIAAAAAQDAESTPTADIASIAASVLSANPETLLTGLATPPADDTLPPGFLNPPSGESANADVVEAFILPADGLTGALGSVSHAFDTDPNVIEGLVSAGVVNFIVSDSEITDEEFSGFELRVATSIRDNLQPGMTGDVERIPLADEEALLISVVLQGSGTVGLVFMVAVPVGNTIVIGTVVVLSSGGMDSVAVLENAVLLTLSGVAYLDAVAANAG